MKHSLILAGAAVLSLASLTSSAATLSSVPMQGGMVMPMVSYNATLARIEVMMPMEIPQLTPLLASNPADSFDPGDPWFDSIDPSRQGASFSMRYGFVMDNVTDPLPASTQIWIRKLSGSPELKAYRHRGTSPKAWEPIFGTDGVTNAMFWSGMMFHPAFTAPPGTNPLTATFEAFLLDTNTGLEVPGSSSGPLVFHWTNVPDGRPELNLQQRIVVGWPENTTTNWVLESAATADSTMWITVTNKPVMLDGVPAVVLEKDPSQQYFRMRFVP